MTQESSQPERTLPSGRERPKKYNSKELSHSPWGRFVLFCNEFSSEFIPRSENNRKTQETKAKVHHQCLEKYLEIPTITSWENLVNQFSGDEYDLANDFFEKLSYRYSVSPQEFLDSGKDKIKNFINYAQFAFSDGNNRDLLKIKEAGDIRQKLNF